MTKIVRLNEGDIENLVKKILKESDYDMDALEDRLSDYVERLKKDVSKGIFFDNDPASPRFGNQVTGPKNLWWGYKHTSGTYQAKRYFGPVDIMEAEQSPFCEMAVGPFEASNREEALEKVRELTNK